MVCSIFLLCKMLLHNKQDTDIKGEKGRVDGCQISSAYFNDNIPDAHKVEAEEFRDVLLGKETLDDKLVFV